LLALLEAIHVSLALLSGAGFAARLGGVLFDAAWLRRRFVRRAPHVVDTLLLASGLALAVSLGLDPAGHPWLAAKLAALVLYIALGLTALRFARRWRLQALAGGGAMLVYAYILAAALTHEVPGWTLLRGF